MNEQTIENKQDIFVYPDYGNDGDHTFGDGHYFQNCYLDGDKVKLYLGDGLWCIEISKQVWDECNESIKEQLERTKK